jgi:hypothetical protein
MKNKYFTRQTISRCRSLAGPARTVRLSALSIDCLFDFVNKCV